MLVLLPPLFFLFVMIAVVPRCGLRQGFVVATAAYTVCIVVATEALSVTVSRRLPEVTAFWSAATALAARWLWPRKYRQRRGVQGAQKRPLIVLGRDFRQRTGA